MRVSRFPFAFVLAALLLVAAPVLAAEEPVADPGPTTLDESASWGIDLKTGKIAIDASLLAYYDPEGRTLVINPNHAADGAAELGAVIQADGSWLMRDGSTITPILGELAVQVGDEPVDLIATSGLPAVDVGQVDLMAAARFSERTRRWRKCTGCTGCLNGCDVNVLYSGDRDWKYCRFSWPWNRCTERFEQTCTVQYFNCRGCTGGVFATDVYFSWLCADNC